MHLELCEMRLSISHACYDVRRWSRTWTPHERSPQYRAQRQSREVRADLETPAAYLDTHQATTLDSCPRLRFDGDQPCCRPCLACFNQIPDRRHYRQAANQISASPC